MVIVGGDHALVWLFTHARYFINTQHWTNAQVDISVVNGVDISSPSFEL